MMLSAQQLEIIRFCAIECRMQRSGEESVYRMIQAYQYAWITAGMEELAPYKLPTVADIEVLGVIIEPIKNRGGWRNGPVWVGKTEKAPFTLVPQMMVELVETYNPDEDDPGDFFLNFENIHPFFDGNGRTGQILYNWHKGTLGAPVWAPDFWNDDRRHPGHGAPE